jgi:hypothetical protein
MKKLFSNCIYSVISVLIMTFTAQADGLVGVDIEEVITVSPGGEELRLRGTAVKKSARQAVYIGGLYVQNNSLDAKGILSSETAKRFFLYCQDSTIKPDALMRALNLGLTVNHTEDELDSLKPMITQFNNIWNSEIKQGDKVWVDYLPGKGTSVSVNGVEKGLIPGKAFYDAFLKTWIGDKPLSKTMKKQLLGDQ